MRGICGLITTVAALSLSLVIPRGAAAQDGELKKCLERYAKLDRSVKWIRADVVSQTRPLIPMEEYYQLTGQIECAPVLHSCVIAADGRTMHSTTFSAKQDHDAIDRIRKLAMKNHQTPVEKPPFTEIVAQLPFITPEERKELSVFDGQQLKQSRDKALFMDGKGLDTLSIVDISRLKSPHFYWVPLHSHMIAFPCPAIPADNTGRKKYRFNDLYADGNLTSTGAMEQVNGLSCLKLEGKGNDGVVKRNYTEEFWVAPSLNYAVVRRTKTVDGHLTYEMDFEDFRSFPGNLWLAGTTTSTSYGYPGIEHYAKYVDKKYMQTHSTYSLLRVDAPEDEELLRFEPKSGTLVHDGEMAKKLGITSRQGEIPGLSYQVPEDKAALNSVVEKAIERQRPPSRLWLYLSIGASAAVAVIFGIWGARKLWGSR